MSGTYISAELRRMVIARAEGLCEYCLLHEDDTFSGNHVDHIISEKHGGLTQEDNLAYACFFCNLHKGSDIASHVPGTQKLVRFFHPRTDLWRDHFALGGDGIRILALSAIGEATCRIFAVNAAERLLERDSLRLVNRYPAPQALRRMK